MRRFKQQLPPVEAQQILTRATHGILSLADAGGRPYGVPMSFVYDGAHTLYFHCAREGRKMDCIGREARASFCVVARDEVHPEEFTTYFCSVIAQGRIAPVAERDQIIAALRLLGEKYAPGVESAPEIARGLDRVAVLRFDVEELTGKEAVELTRRR